MRFSHIKLLANFFLLLHSFAQVGIISTVRSNNITLNLFLCPISDMILNFESDNCLYHFKENCQSILSIRPLFLRKKVINHYFSPRKSNQSHLYIRKIYALLPFSYENVTDRYFFIRKSQTYIGTFSSNQYFFVRKSYESLLFCTKVTNLYFSLQYISNTKTALCFRYYSNFYTMTSLVASYLKHYRKNGYRISF